MMKILLVQAFLVGNLCAQAAAFLTFLDGGLEGVDMPVIWKGKSSRKPPKKNFVDGCCELFTTRSYEAGQFSVNVTFDSKVDSFKISEPFNWEKQSQSKDNWYFYVTKFPIEAGQNFTIDFSASDSDGRRSTRGKSKRRGREVGSNLPTGTCFGRGELDDCSIDVDFGGISVDTGSFISGKGSCIFTLLENATTGDLTVNVTFQDTVLTFANRDLLSLNSSSPGVWYFSESQVDFFTGDTLTYEFDVTWENVDFPEGTCLSNVACDEVMMTTTTTTPGPTLPPID